MASSMSPSRSSRSRRRRRRPTVAFQVTPTFVPGKDDTRSLGVQVDSIRLATDRWWVRSARACGPRSCWALPPALLLVRSPLPALAGVVLLLILAAMIGLTLTQGFGAYIPLPWQVPLIGAVDRGDPQLSHPGTPPTRREHRRADLVRRRGGPRVAALASGHAARRCDFPGASISGRAGRAATTSRRSRPGTISSRIRSASTS